MAVVAPGLAGQVSAAVADAVAEAALALGGVDGIPKVEEMIEKLKAENLALYGEPVVEKTARARLLLDSVRLQPSMKKMVKEKKETALLFAVEKAMRENRVVMEQLKKDVLTVALKVRKQIGTLAASLKQAQTERGCINEGKRCGHLKG